VEIGIVVALFGLLLALKGVELVWQNWDLEATTMPISTAWLYVPMILVGIVIALQATREATESRSPRVYHSTEPEGRAE